LRQPLRPWAVRVACTMSEWTVPTQPLTVSTLEGTQHRATPVTHALVPGWHRLQWVPGVAQLDQAPVSSLDGSPEGTLVGVRVRHS